MAGLATSPFTANAATSSYAKEIAQKYILVDTHIDVPYRLEEAYDDVTQATEKGDFDHPRAVAGGLDAPFMSIYIPATLEKEGGGKALADRLIDRVEAMVGRAPDKFALAYSVADIKNNFKLNKISLPMGMENGTAIEGSLDNLAHFYQRGIRYITLAHSLSNHISDSSYSEDRPWQGLSPFGKKLITEMNNIGIMIDISHVSDQAFYQAVELSKVPVIASHSSLRYFTPGFERNMSDDMLLALKKNGGVVQINFGSSFVTEEANKYRDKVKSHVTQFMTDKGIADKKDAAAIAFEKAYKEKDPFPFASTADVVDHIDRAVKITGIDHVGIGSDYDGVGDSLPTGLKDVSTFPNLIQELLDRKYSEADIEKLMGANVLRVWQQVEDYAEKH
ncbi:dipeptidase [Thalassotalea atypica]|uniref:dipeptidase n=1 Tax=Thalassotalea atypica TaxID=2054316 RepID=UPI002573C953|nr:dipeptidase [Thalassotalea atypica]